MKYIGTEIEKWPKIQVNMLIPHYYFPGFNVDIKLWDLTIGTLSHL